MKFTKGKLPPLFRSRQSTERNKFLDDSFASSFVLCESLANWSSSYDPQARLCVMKFDKEWQNPNCPVMKWYELQTCRKFKSIQHWRNLDTQFYHEFLIIQLIDGSACRVERMGEGSRADAIRYVGCTAFDLIQWFSDKNHATKRWSRGSNELIIELEFPAPFDLLDVLAVCYTIQHKCRQASVYTLQRYNCYFLCNTILVVLTRRVAQWETQITEDSWATIAGSMMDELKFSSRLPVEQQHPTHFFALGICSLLDSSNPDPTGFLLDPLQNGLNFYSCDQWNGGLGLTLWYKHIDVIINGWLIGLSELMVEGMIGDPAPRSAVQRLLSLLGDIDEECYPPSGVNLSLTRKIVSREVLGVLSSPAQDFVTSLVAAVEMQELEQKSPRRQRLIASMVGSLFCAIPMSLTANLFREAMYGQTDDDVSRFFQRFDVTIGHVASTIPRAMRFRFMKVAMIASLDELDIGDDNLYLAGQINDAISTAIHRGAERMLSILLTILHPDSGPRNVPATLAFLNHYLCIQLWQKCLLARLCTLSKAGFYSVLEGKSSTILTNSLRMSEMGALDTVQTIHGFQTYIQQRIQIHAERVESFKLAAAPLIQRDIERSMTQVWLSLPSGFGARHHASRAPIIDKGDQASIASPEVSLMPVSHGS